MKSPFASGVRTLGLSLASLLLISACGGTASPTTHLDKIKSSGTLTVGIAIDPPFSLQDASGKWYSFNPELLSLLAQHLGLKIQYVPGTFATIVAGLLASQYDMIGASLSATPERAKVVDFSIPYAYTGTVWLVRKDNPKHPASIADLNNSNVTIAVELGSAEEQRSRRLIPNAQYRALTGGPQRLAEVTSGHAQAVAETSFIVPALLQQFPELTAIPADVCPPGAGVCQGVEPSGVVWAVRKNDPEFLAALNDFLQKATSDGTISKLAAADLTAANTK